MDWFRHDLYAQQDIKIRKLIRKYGYEGYGLYWHAVELMYQNDGNMGIEDLFDEFELIGHEDFPQDLQDLGLIEVIKEGENKGCYTSSRVQEEIDYQRERVERFRNMGRASAESRRNKSTTQVEHKLNVSSTQVEHQPTNQPTYLPIEKESKEKKNDELSLTLLDGSLWSVPSEFIKNKQTMYPTIDAYKTFLDIQDATKLHPAKRPRIQNINGFVTKWFENLIKETNQTEAPKKSAVCNDPAEMLKGTINREIQF